jgi:hypothetical protein
MAVIRDKGLQLEYEEKGINKAWKAIRFFICNKMPYHQNISTE